MITALFLHNLSHSTLANSDLKITLSIWKIFAAIFRVLGCMLLKERITIDSFDGLTGLSMYKLLLFYYRLFLVQNSFQVFTSEKNMEK